MESIQLYQSNKTLNGKKCNILSYVQFPKHRALLENHSYTQIANTKTGH